MYAVGVLTYINKTKLNMLQTGLRRWIKTINLIFFKTTVF